MSEPAILPQNYSSESKGCVDANAHAFWFRARGTILSVTVAGSLEPSNGIEMRVCRPKPSHLRPWYMEHPDQYLIFTRRGIDIESYPAVLEYLSPHRERLEPKPSNWKEVVFSNSFSQSSAT